MIRRLLLALCLLPSLVWATCPSDNYAVNGVCPDSPCHWFRMDASSGTTETDQGFGAGAEGGKCAQSTANATYSGGFTLSQTGIVGAGTDKATAFNGSTGKLVSTEGTDYFPDMTLNGGWSVEAWIKMVGTDGYVAIKDNVSASCGNEWEWYFYNNAGAISFAIRNSTSSCTSGLYASPSAGSGLNDGNYHHVVATTLGAGGTALTNLKLSVDGSQVNSTTVFSGTPCNNNNTYVVRLASDKNGAACGLNGTIDEFALYHVQLSTTQITAHYNAGIAVGTTGRGMWPFTVRRPELPRFRNDDYLAQFVSHGYNTGLFASREIVPKFLSVGFMPFSVIPWGNVGH